MQKRENYSGLIKSVAAFSRIIHSNKLIFLLLMLLTLKIGLFAQAGFPNTNFWSLDAGVGMSGILVEGASFQFILDPKLSLSPPLMIGSRIGISYSTDEILSFESQAYLRWNFLRLSSERAQEKVTNIFIQGGVGILASYRGGSSPFNDVTMTRGSLLLDAATGVTIPLNPRWHIEPSIRGGYPHIFGVSITAGYKFPLAQRTVYVQDLSSRQQDLPA